MSSFTDNIEVSGEVSSDALEHKIDSIGINAEDFLPPKFIDIIQSQHFFMRQTSDVNYQNSYDHCSFVSSIPVEEIMKQDMSSTVHKNTLVTDRYMSWFITKRNAKKNEKMFNKHPDLRDQFIVIDSYNDLFAGFLRIENFVVLVNTENLTEFNVYTLIDNTHMAESLNGKMKANIEYYGLIKIGTLVNPRGYTEEEIEQFEQKHSFLLKEDIKEYLKRSSLISFNKKLFHVDLLNESDFASKFFDGTRCSFNNIKFLQSYKKNGPDEETIAQEEKEMNDAFDGFLCLGIVSNELKRCKDNDENVTICASKEVLFLLVNYNSEEESFQRSLWTYKYDNNNVQKYIDNINEKGKRIDKSLKINFEDRRNIFKTFRFCTNF
jgi:hypothetical protein